MAKRKRHNPEQIVRKLQEADRLLNAGKSVAHVILYRARFFGRKFAGQSRSFPDAFSQEWQVYHPMRGWWARRRV